VSKNYKFYGRNSAGKYPPDVGELRTAFTLSETVAERIRNFRVDRIARLALGQLLGTGGAKKRPGGRWWEALERSKP
jgi:hypothetical protein